MVPTAIDILIGIEDFVIDTFMTGADAIPLIIIRGHIEDEDEVGIADFPFEGEDALIGIVDHKPGEMGWVMLLEMHGGLGRVDAVKVADHAFDGIMLRVGEEFPWKGFVLIPFIEGSEFVTHEI